MHPVLRLIDRNLTVALSPVFLLWQVLFPLMFVFIAGLSYATIVPSVTSSGVEHDYQTFLATGLIGYNIMNSALISGVLILNDRKYGMFEQILLGPFTRRHYILANTAVMGMLGTASGAVVLLFGLPLFVDSVVLEPATLPLLAFASVTGSVLYGSLAIIVCMLVRSYEGVTVALETAFLLFAYVSTAYYPIEGIPEPLRTAFALNPLTHLTDTIRAGLFGTFGAGTVVDMAALAAVAGALFVVASRMISRAEV